MAFYLGAMAGTIGNALQADNKRASDVAIREKERKENRTDLLMNAALDLGTQTLLERKKERKNTKESIEKGMASLPQSLSRAVRFQIAKGGSSSISNVNNLYSKALENGTADGFASAYTIKNTDAFKDMSDDEFFNVLIPPVSSGIATQTSRAFLKRQKEFYPDLDLTDTMSKFKTMVDTSDDASVADSLTLGNFAVDTTALSAAIKEPEKRAVYASPTAAITDLKSKIQDQKDLGDDANANVISNLEGRIKAHQATLNDAKSKDSKPTYVTRMKEIPVELVELRKKPVENEIEISRLVGELKVYREAATKDKAAESAPKETTPDNILNNVSVKLIEELNKANPDQKVIAQLRKQQDTVITEKKKMEGDKPVFTQINAQSYVESRKNDALVGVTFTETKTISGDMIRKFGAGTENHKKYIAGISSVIKSLRKSNTTWNNDAAINVEIRNLSSVVDNEINSYVNKFGMQPIKENKAFKTKQVLVDSKKPDSGKRTVMDLDSNKNPQRTNAFTPAELEEKVLNGDFTIGDMVWVKEYDINNIERGMDIKVFTGSEFR